MSKRVPIARKLFPNLQAPSSSPLSSAPELSSSPSPEVDRSSPAKTPGRSVSGLPAMEALLDPETRRNFINTVNHITRLGNRKPKLVEPRRQKLWSIVEANKQIWVLYNEYAKVQAAGEKRMTYRLPVFEGLVVEETGQKEGVNGKEEQEDAIRNDDGEEFQDAMEVVEEGALTNEGVADDEKPEAHAIFERLAGGTLLLQVHGVQEQAGKEGGDTVQEGSEMAVEQEEATLLEDDITTTTRTQSLDIEMVDVESPCHAASLRAAASSNPPLCFFPPVPLTTSTSSKKQVQFQDDRTRSETQTPATRFNSEHLQQRSPTSTIPPGLSSPVERAASLSTILVEPSSPPQDSSAIGAVSPTPTLHGEPHSPLLHSTPSTLNHRYIIPVTNPETFPIHRIQDIQAQRYPSAKVVSTWSHRNIDGDIVQVTANVQDGPVNHLTIKDARIITALGLRSGAHDVIQLRDEELRIDETFSIYIAPTQRVRGVRAFVVGELRPARHAYLHWLDSRGSADPRGPPYAQEAKRIALQLGRRAMDVWKEIEGYWVLEQNAGGIVYRMKRLRYLGEDPVYTIDQAKNAGARVRMRSMWG